MDTDSATASIPVHLARQFEPVTDKGRVKINSPKILCVYILESDKSSEEKAKLTLNFFSIITDICLKQGVRLHLDFTRLQRITASAALMLFSEISRIQLVTDTPDVITFTEPSEPACKQVFRKTGLYRAIMPGTYRKLVGLFDEDQPFQSGDDPNKFLISSLLALNKQGLELSKPEVKVVSKGIQEAMLNVMHHAYANEEKPNSGIGTRWWQLCLCNPSKKEISFIIYDKGSSIPISIRDRLAPDATDADCIEFAFRKGVSRFSDRPERGKGSEDIRQVATVRVNSSLLVMSGQGMYYVNSTLVDVVKLAVPLSVGGTLVEWSIPYE